MSEKRCARCGARLGPIEARGEVCNECLTKAAEARERAEAPKDEDGYPVERGIPLPVHLDLLG